MCEKSLTKRVAKITEPVPRSNSNSNTIIAGSNRSKMNQLWEEEKEASCWKHKTPPTHSDSSYKQEEEIGSKTHRCHFAWKSNPSRIPPREWVLSPDTAGGIVLWYWYWYCITTFSSFDAPFLIQHTRLHTHIFFLLDIGSSKRQLLFKPGTSTALCVRGNCTLSGKYNYYIIPLDGNELLEIHTKSLFVNKFSYMFLMIEILKYGIKLWRLNG